MDNRAGDDAPSAGPNVLYTPEQVAERLGGMSVKSLAELIRKSGAETTTIGIADEPRKGGRKRRVWGMTEPQLQELIRRWRPGKS